MTRAARKRSDEYLALAAEVRRWRCATYDAIILGLAHLVPGRKALLARARAALEAYRKTGKT